MISQSISIAGMYLSTLIERLSQSLVVVVGIGGVSAVIIGLMSFAAGYQSLMQASGEDDRILILRAGSESEINGNIPMDARDAVAQLSIVESINDQKLIARETYVTAKLPNREGQLASFPIRGVESVSYLVRPEVQFIEGDKPTPGKFELAVGVQLADRFSQFSVGESISIKGVNWQVTGKFTSNGTLTESEVWADERTLAAIHNRGDTFSSMLVRVSSPSALRIMEEEIMADRRFNLRPVRESDYYAAQSSGMVEVIEFLTILLGGIMSVGAVFSALNTMYATMSERKREIATLQALGFGALPIFLAVLIEAECLAFVGCLVAALLLFIALDGATISSLGSNFTQAGITVNITSEMFLTGVAVALLLGAIGGAIPAITSLRGSVIDGLRARH